VNACLISSTAFSWETVLFIELYLALFSVQLKFFFFLFKINHKIHFADIVNFMFISIHG